MTDMNQKISAHFSLREMCRSQTATRQGIDNTPGPMAVDGMVKLARAILEPVRMQFGKPFTPSSGFRSASLNKAIGSKSTSQHCSGQAVDFEIGGIANDEVARWIKHNLDFDQLILEFYDGKDPNSGWIHVSYVSTEGNRKQSLVYYGKSYALFE